MLTDEQFNMGLAKLAAAHKDFEMTPATVEVYRERLRTLTPAEWELAVNYCLDNRKFFPKISELLEASQAGRPVAEEIWGRLLVAAEDDEKPAWIDEATERALLAVGGWEAFSVTPYDELRFFFKIFKEVYQVARKQEQLRVEGPEPQRRIDGQVS